MVWLTRRGKRLSVLFVLFILVYVGGTAKADFFFGEASRVSGVNSPLGDHEPQISRDGLELYFASSRAHGGDACQDDIWVSRRSSAREAWGAPTKLSALVNTAGPENSPCISPDGLELYFSDGWGVSSSGCTPARNVYGGCDLWVSVRASRGDPWSEPANLGDTINTASNEDAPCISRDGLTLYFMSDQPGGHGNSDIYMSTRPTSTDSWGPPSNLGSTINTGSYEGTPYMASDGLSLFFSRGQANYSTGGFDSDIYVARRATTTSPWDTPVPFSSLNAVGKVQYNPSFSLADSAVYFARGDSIFAQASFDIWKVEVIPVVDFSGDGLVDGDDICAMIDCWGTDDSLCDIGPASWGDGMVDVEDLRILVEYIDREIEDPTLTAHWAFDETAGDAAADNAGDHPGAVTGACLWCPDAGQVDGALELDGTTFVVTDHILSPSDGAFSVLVWVQGGAAGQVVVSQDSGSDWLAIDPDSGSLMTAIAPPKSRKPVGPLVSDAIVIDGLWHRIALVWDGTSRSLFVDGTLVATDEQGSLVSCTGGLNIGCGTDTTPASFFTGLIDDVRIYNRAVKP